MLAEAMIVDRRRLAARWMGVLRLQREGRRVDARTVDGLRLDWERSTERRAKRREAKPTPAFDQKLPILEHREAIAETIRTHQVTVICGETGSGKTTQIPQICLSLGLGEAGMIGHTQPRRIAARTLATRIGQELKVAPGSRSVGYKVRFGDETDKSTHIKVMTDGILLAETQGDRLLEAYDTIIIDEAHERSLNIDFLMGYLRQMLPRRPDLKVIITSATIDPERFARHFADLGGVKGPAPVVSVSGRTYPVEVRYRPIGDGDIETALNPGDEDQAIIDAIDELFISERDAGSSRGRDVLVFLPGEREIREAAEALRKHHPPGVEILPLFSRLSPAEQMRVFQPSGARRIVLATNVAETSLTVPGIKYVVDTGYARMSRYSHKSKIQRLPIEPISRASANQRMGRCGRVQEGVCIRLYAEEDFKQRPEFTEPEILRTNLASVILQMIALNLGKVEEFPFVEPPDSRMIKDAYDTLHELGAIDAEGRLTKTGHALAKFPIDPRLARMLIGADAEGSLAEVLVIASALSIQDPRERPLAKQDQADLAHKRFWHEESDFVAFLNLWREYQKQQKHLSGNRLRNWCRDNFLSFVRMREWDDVHGQLAQLSGELGLRTSPKPAGYDQVHRALLSGLLSNCGFKAEQFEYTGSRGMKFNIFPGSALFKKGPKWVVAAEIVETTRRFARIVAKVQPEWIEELAQHVVKKSYSDPHWQKDHGSVAAFERVTLYGLVLAPRRRANYGPVDPADARDIFIQHALVEAEWAWSAAFMQHNQRVIAQVRELEAKVRKADVLAEKQAIYDFYDARVPKGVFSISTFEPWRKDAEKSQPKLLYMSAKDVMRREVPEATPDQFPDALDVFGTRLNVQYKLEPGAADDGVTLDVPIENLNQLDADRAEWLVPGLLKEKILALIKNLPKQHRVQLDAAQMAETLAGGLPFGQGNLFEALSAGIDKLLGVQVPPGAWTPQALPDYLRMHIRVRDEKGGLLAAGRDPVKLKAQLAERARAHLEKLARKSFGREGLTEWTFDDLPEKFEMDRQGQTVVGFPALVDKGESVALTLLESAAHARYATHRGVRRLFAIAAQNEIDGHLWGQKNRQKLALYYGPLGKPEQLMADLRLLVAERAFMSGPAAHVAAAPIRTREQFEKRQQERWGKVGLVAREVAELAERILQQRQQIALRLDKTVPDDWKDNAADAADQLARLCPPGFLASTPDQRLRDYPRYLEAIVVRLRKLDNGNSGRDTRSLNALMPLWRRYIAAAGKVEQGLLPRADPAALDEHRWLLEELRVSLFAERLGTSEPVSVKRLNDQWEAVGAERP